MKPLTIALAKGRLLDPSARLLASLGFDLNGAANSRQLIWDDAARGARFLIAKPSDVPIYVENGAADAGIVGQDVLRESDADVYEPLALNYGFCRLVVAGKAEHAAADWRFNAGLRVATKYPRAAQKFFSARGLAAEIIGLAGSVELAPMVGLADLIVDLVDTGRTLKVNGLIELAEIFKSQAAFIVNRASFALRADELRAMMEKIEQRRER